MVDSVSIKSASYSNYCFTFNKPIKIGTKILTQRSGTYLQFITSCGLVTKAELAPLPGLHKENLTDALQNIKETIAQIIGKEITVNDFNEQKYPSSQFALECALLDLLAQKKSLDFARYLNPKADKKINLNGLLLINDDNLFEKTKFLLNSGFKTIKIKIGLLPVVQEIKLLQQLFSLYKSSSVIWRLDSNRRLDLSDAIFLANNIDLDSVEYIEEPIKDPRLLTNFYRQTGLKIALDESLLEYDNFNFIDLAAVAAFIIKPNLWGGINATRSFCDKNKKYGKKIILTSCFETDVGLKYLTNLSKSLNLYPNAMGLDNHL